MKHKFKIGDWVVLEVDLGRYWHLNKVWRIGKIESNVHYPILNGKIDHSAYLTTSMENCRLAQPHEIPVEFRKQQYYFY